MKILSLVLATFVLYLSIQRATAYTFTKNSSGNALSWSSPANPTFYTNWYNNSGLTYNQVFTALTNALQRWKYAGSANISFDYWQGHNAGTPANYARDYRNAVFFSSQSSQKLSSSTIAVTYVYSQSGTIVETDVEFNDDNFTFTTTASDSSRFGSSVFLENAATHEFGHAYGLGHSAALQSAMVYLEYRSQAKLSCDDIEGIGVLYQNSSFTSGRGQVTGYVYSGATAVFGAHVLAISKTRGTVISSAITYPNGSYILFNLEPGSYYLMVEPFQGSAPISALCGGSASGCYYGSVNSHNICSGSPFKRGFHTSSAGIPTTVSVTASNTTTVNDFNISCSDMTTKAGVASSYAEASGGAVSAVLSNTNSGTYAVIGQLSSVGNEQWFKMTNVSGQISAKAIAYNLYSGFDVKVTITDSTGAAAAGVTITDNVFTGSSNYVNYDSTSELNASAGTYYIKVENLGFLASSKYPAGNSNAYMIDSLKYYLLVISINDSTSLLPSSGSPTMANNARCEATDSFSAFTDHGSPSESSLAPQDSAASAGSGSGVTTKIGGCGMIENINDHSSNGPGADALFSIWGIILMMAIYRFGHQFHLATKHYRR